MFESKKQPTRVEREKFPGADESGGYESLQALFEEEQCIFEAIDEVFANTPSRAAAEKIVLEEYAPILDETLRKIDDAFKRWFDALTKASNISA